MIYITSTDNNQYYLSKYNQIILFTTFLYHVKYNLVKGLKV